MVDRKNIENPLYHNTMRKFLGGGRKPITLEYKGYLCKYIDVLLKLNIPVSTSLIILETINKVPGFIGKSYNSYHLWVYDFLKRNRYSIIKVTDFQQKLPYVAFEKIYELLKECMLTRIFYNID